MLSSDECLIKINHEVFFPVKSEKQQFIINSINIWDIKQIQLYEAQYVNIYKANNYIRTAERHFRNSIFYTRERR